MAGTPRFKVYDASGQYQAATKRPEEAAVLVSFLGVGSTIRDGHKFVAWTEGVDGVASESYDITADHVYAKAGLKAHGE